MAASSPLCAEEGEKVRILLLNPNSTQMVTQRIQLQFIVCRDLPQLLNIEWRKPGSTGNQDRLSCFARG